MSDAATPELTQEQVVRRSASGFAWLLTQTLLNKGVATISTLAIAALLGRAELGLFGLATTVTTVCAIPSQLGIREVLIQKRNEYGTWAPTAFWVSGGVGVACALLTLAAIPFAERMYNEPGLGSVLWIMAFALPLSNLGVLPDAWATLQLRFRFIAGLGVATNVLSTAVGIALAWAGFGALAVAIPKPVTALFRLGVLWGAARPPSVGWQADRTKIKPLAQSSLALLGVSLVTTVINQADYVALGWFHSAEVVGVYFFAFNLSLQTLQLLTSNLTGVLFPILANIADEDRRVATFVDSARVLTVVGIPIALLQVPAAGPAISLLFGTKWAEAVAPLQFLSVSMALRVASAPAASLIKAQGRFSHLALTQGIMAVTFVAVVGVAAWLGGATTVAAAVAAWSLLPSALLLFVATGRHAFARTWLHLHGLPLAIGVVSSGATLVALRFVPWTGRWHDAAALSTVALVGGSLALLGMRIAAPEAWRVAVGKLGAVLGKRPGPSARSSGS